MVSNVYIGEEIDEWLSPLTRGKKLRTDWSAIRAKHSFVDTKKDLAPKLTSTISYELQTR